MDPLAQFESLVAHIVEGLPARLLGGNLEPVEIAKRLRRVMQERRRVGPNGLEVPNRYVISLNRDDLAGLGDYRAVLERELAHYLEREARDAAYHIPGHPQVVLQEGSSLGRREVAIEAQWAQPGAVKSAADEQAALEGRTTRLNVGQLAEATQMKRVVLALYGRGKPVWQAAVERFPASLGRALDNDVIIEDGRVSRHHAQIVPQGSKLSVVDLGSANGTLVNGERVERCLLQNGDVISLGGLELTVQFDTDAHS